MFKGWSGPGDLNPNLEYFPFQDRPEFYVDHAYLIRIRDTVSKSLKLELGCLSGTGIYGPTFLTTFPSGEVRGSRPNMGLRSSSSKCSSRFLGVDSRSVNSEWWVTCVASF